jgi:hypothetical protein
VRATTSSRQQRIADFYTRVRVELQRAVAGRARTTDATIEDACQTGSATLLRRPDAYTMDAEGSSPSFRITSRT